MSRLSKPGELENKTFSRTLRKTTAFEDYGTDAEKEQLSYFLPEYVKTNLRASYGDMYVCPFCGSGTGPKGTGAFGIVPENQTKFNCFSCNKTGDLFDLIGQVEGIPDYNGQKARAVELYGSKCAGLPVTGKKAKTERPAAAREARREEDEFEGLSEAQYNARKKDLEEYYQKCQMRLHETLYHRGLSMNTMARFKIGYDPEWKNPKNPNGPASPRLIIPTDKLSYIARSTEQIKKEYRVMAVGNKQLFNSRDIMLSDSPIFIVEGEIDAMSIVDAGGAAVGLGGVANYNKLVNFILDYCPNRETPLPPLIIALDNDDAGEDTTKKLSEAFSAYEIDYRIVNIYGDKKDANEALNADREALEYKIKNVLDLARLDYIKEKSIAGYLDTFIEHIKRGYTPIPTGFQKFDKYALDGGLMPGLIFLGAISSLGKTSFVLQVADNMARAGYDVLYFSLEMSRIELISKSLSRISYVNSMGLHGNKDQAMTTGDFLKGTKGMTPTKIEAVDNALKVYRNEASHMFICEGNDGEKEALNVEGIYKRVELHTATTGAAPVVFVDYLQILPADPRLTDKANINAAVKRLKDISRDFNTPVICISSFNRQNYHSDVNMEAFKESGGIEYSGDLVLGMQLHGQEKEAQNTPNREKFNQKREKRKDPRDIEIQILKNRNGKISKCGAFKFYSGYNYFEETDFDE